MSNDREKRYADISLDNILNKYDEIGWSKHLREKRRDGGGEISQGFGNLLNTLGRNSMPKREDGYEK